MLDDWFPTSNDDSPGEYVSPTMPPLTAELYADIRKQW